MEKYGEVPKRFTKAWWEYFWDYYKWHTILVVFLVAIIVTTIYQVVTRTEYDFTVTLLGDTGFSDEQIDGLELGIAEFIEDINGDGEKHVMLQQIISQPTLAGQQSDAEFEMALAAKTTVELATGEANLFLLSEEEANELMNDPQCEGLFMPVAEWTDIGEDSELMLSGGTAYAIRLSKSRFFAEKEADASRYYMAVRVPRENEKKDEEALARFENAKTAAKALVAQ